MIPIDFNLWLDDIMKITCDLDARQVYLVMTTGKFALRMTSHMAT